jgi:hypothetical protein
MSFIEDERPQVNEVYAKLIEAKKQFLPVHKTRQGHNYKYADLESIFKSIQPALSKAGLMIIQQGEVVNGLDYIRTIIASACGDEIDFGVTPVKTIKPDAQAFGSGLTYARRYAIGMALGLTPEDDDDGQLASIASPVDAVRANVRKLANEAHKDYGYSLEEITATLKGVSSEVMTQEQAYKAIESLSKLIEMSKKGKA